MAKNRKNRGRFAGVPMFVMESSAYVTLPPLARSLLYELAAQYNGRNNGYLSLTRADLKARGFNTPASNTKAIRALIEANLITQTRSGGIAKGKRICNLFALNWQSLDERVDRPFDNSFSFKGSFRIWLADKSREVKVLTR